jgi:hypothetical protein
MEPLREQSLNLERERCGRRAGRGTRRTRRGSSRRRTCGRRRGPAVTPPISAGGGLDPQPGSERIRLSAVSSPSALAPSGRSGRPARGSSRESSLRVSARRAGRPTSAAAAASSDERQLRAERAPARRIPAPVHGSRTALRGFAMLNTLCPRLVTSEPSGWARRHRLGLSDGGSRGEATSTDRQRRAPWRRPRACAGGTTLRATRRRAVSSSPTAAWALPRSESSVQSPARRRRVRAIAASRRTTGAARFSTTTNRRVLGGGRRRRDDNRDRLAGERSLGRAARAAGSPPPSMGRSFAVSTATTPVLERRIPFDRADARVGVWASTAGHGASAGSMSAV